MKGIKKALTTKLGPLPRWAWVVLVVVGFVLYKRRQAQQAQGQQQDATNAQYGLPTNPDLSYVPGGSIPIGPPDSGWPGGGDAPGDGTKSTPPPAKTPPAPHPGSTGKKHKPRKVKPKPHHKPKKTSRPKSTHPPKPTTRSHSTSPTWREKRQTGKPVPKILNRSTRVISTPSKLRNRMQTSIVSRHTQATQRPPATHPVAHPVSREGNPPRPSAPPKRTQRTRRK